MAVSLAQARRICSATELRVVAASQPAALEALTPGRLRQKIGVARRLRNKWRDQARRQRRARQGKAAARGAVRAAQETRTRKKAQLFQETLARFEKRRAALEKAARAARKKSAREASKKGSARPRTRAGRKLARRQQAARKRAARKSTRAGGGLPRELPRAKGREAAAAHADARRKSARFERTAQHRIHGHVSSRGRRRQARRDAR
jgi:hypothetical protein